MKSGRRRNEVIGLLDNGQVRMAESRRDGEYLVFESDQISEILLLEPERSGAVWLWPAGPAVLLLGAVWLAARKRRQSSPAAHQEETKDGNTEEGSEETGGKAGEEPGGGKAEKDREGSGAGKAEEGRDETGAGKTGESRKETGD